ncbi:MAG: phage tail protein [Calditrichae bacterium]|nr:phage tail protein [Calditrichia bacterium]
MRQKLAFFILFVLISTPLFSQEAIIGEIRMFAGNFAPRGWAFCEGQLLPIAQNTALFSILGTTYGGDGRTTFALPDLRGRAAIHPGTGPGLTNKRLGEMGGQENVTLTINEIPAHSHNVTVNADSSVATSDKPQDGLPARNAAATPQYGTTSNSSLNASAVAIEPAGGGQAHPNMPPFTAINFIIATQGIYPSRP